MQQLRFNGDITLEQVFSEYRTEIYDNLVQAIRENLEEELDQVTVLVVGINSIDYTVNLTKDKFESSLKSAISYYEKLELYEKCEECLDLLNKLKNN